MNQRMKKQTNKDFTEHLSRGLSAARARSGLSQKTLAERSGLPQSHISKIENHQVDMRLSSLVSLSRLLGLELVLVPKIAMPGVQAIIQQFTEGKEVDWDAPMYRLDDEVDNEVGDEVNAEDEDDRPLFAQATHMPDPFD